MAAIKFPGMLAERNPCFKPDSRSGDETPSNEPLGLRYDLPPFAQVLWRFSLPNFYFFRIPEWRVPAHGLTFRGPLP